MNLKIRDFCPEDKEFFINSCIQFYDSPAVSHMVDPKNFARTFDVCIQGSPFVHGMIFLQDGVRAGYALVTFTYSNEAGGLSVLLDEAYILEDFRGSGIGTTFFNMMEEHFVRAGKAKRLRLEVTRENKGAIALYERLGYEPLDYLQMVKDF